MLMHAISMMSCNNNLASTNGSFLALQATASLVRAMVTRKDTWGQRYGVVPGYGINMQDGFEDTFTATVHAALEMGAMKWAKGLVDHQFSNYVRLDGTIHYRGEEISQTARMLTMLALYYSYTHDETLLLAHFPKAKAIADWLMARRELSLAYPKTDARYHTSIWFSWRALIGVVLFQLPHVWDGACQEMDIPSAPAGVGSTQPSFMLTRT